MMRFVFTLSLLAVSLHSSDATTCQDLEKCQEYMQKLQETGGGKNMAEMCRVMPTTQSTLECLREALADCRTNPNFPKNIIDQAEQVLKSLDARTDQCKGVSYTATGDGSDSASADFSDCNGHKSLVDACKDQHLQYLGTTDIATDLEDVPQLDDPNYLIQGGRLTAMCGADNGDAVHLREYFECVFINLTDCLVRQNRSEINMPDGGRISKGVYELCQHKGHINFSCIDAINAKVQSCYNPKTVTGEDQCSVFDALVECTEEHAAECDGGKYIVAFLEAGRPQLCGTGAGNRNIVVIWFLLLAVFTSFLAARV